VRVECLGLPAPRPRSCLVRARVNPRASSAAQGSKHRRVAEVLLNEIGRRATNDRLQDREGFSLAAGRPTAHLHLLPSTFVQPVHFRSLRSTFICFVSEPRLAPVRAGLALGLVTLGQGNSATGLADLQIENRLRKYISGGRAEVGAISLRPLPQVPQCVLAAVCP
jgi:hypothetical protein